MIYGTGVDIQGLGARRELTKTRTYHGVDDEGNITSVSAEEVERAASRVSSDAWKATAAKDEQAKAREKAAAAEADKEKSRGLPAFVPIVGVAVAGLVIWAITKK